MGGAIVRTVVVRVLVGAALVAAAGGMWSAAAGAKTPKAPKPAIAGLSAAPSIVAGPSGYVHLSATSTGATSCTFTTTSAGATLTPATVSCSSGIVASTLFVPENTGKKPAKVHLMLAASGPGGTKSAKLTIAVDPGDGGCSVPGAPAGVVATASNGSASVSVMPPVSNGGKPVLSYTVTAIDLTSTSNGGQTASGNSSPLTVTGLTDGDTYWFSATATNLIGTGPASPNSNKVTPDAVPGMPTGVTALVGDAGAVVSFVPPTNAGTDTTYRVVATDLTTSANGGQTTSGSTSPVKVAGLTDGDSYEFTVQAVDAVGSGTVSAASNQVIPEPLPDTPTGVTAVAGNQQATVTFVPAVDGDPATSFEAIATDHTSPADGGQIAVGSGPLTVTGLTDGDTYTFTVTAQIGTIESAASLPSNAVVPSAGDLTGADQAVAAGQSAYVAGVNANPDLVQCNTGTAQTSTCGGIRYGSWYPVSGSTTEHYAFGNPQPTFDVTTHAIDDVTIQIAGAAYDPSAANNYDFSQETIALDPANGLLDNVWWSNFESFDPSGDYSGCNYNWQENYDAYNDVNNGTIDCGPVFFGANDYLFGPVFTNDSVFVNGDGGIGTSPSFGTSSSPSAVRTADPNCLFVDLTSGMTGSSSNCSQANGDVAAYDAPASSYGNAVEAPPSSDGQLGAEAADNGCLYSGPTQVTLSTVVVNGRNVGRMTVTSPDTNESTVSDAGTPVTWDNNNAASNFNDCPNNGSADLPSNGVVYVENATLGDTVTGANPFDDYVADSVTNLTANPTVPHAGSAVVLTATVTSSDSHIGTGATVAFNQTVSTTGGGTATSPINGCSSSANWSTPVSVGDSWQSSVTCSTTEASNGTGAFSAIYSGGSDTAGSQGPLGQTTSLSPGMAYGPDSQTVAGGCPGCYYGQTAAPDSEGDAFVNGSLSGELTIGTQNNVVIDGNLTYADCSGRWTTGQSGQTDFCPYSVAGPNDSLGLVAHQYVEVNHPIAGINGRPLASCGASPGVLCDPAAPSGASVNGAGQPGLTIDAAVLAVTQSFLTNNYGVGGSDGQLAIYGSVGQYARGPIGTFSNGQSVSGYIKHYTWDPLLGFLAPPDYLGVSPSWALGSVGQTGGGGSTSVCPALFGSYAGTDSGGVIQDGPAVTQSCAASSGGLPNYP